MHGVGKFESKVETIYKSIDKGAGQGEVITEEGVEQLEGGDSVEVWPATAAWFLGPKVSIFLFSDP